MAYNNGHPGAPMNPDRFRFVWYRVIYSDNGVDAIGHWAALTVDAPTLGLAVGRQQHLGRRAGRLRRVATMLTITNPAVTLASGSVIQLALGAGGAHSRVVVAVVDPGERTPGPRYRTQKNRPVKRAVFCFPKTPADARNFFRPRCARRRRRG